MKKLLFCLLLMLITTASFSASWENISPELKIDVSSIAMKNHFLKAWFSNVFSKSHDGNQFTQFKVYNWEKELIYFDCKSREYATMQILYYMDGDYLGSYTNTLLRSTFLEVAPDTIGELEMKIVCSKNPKKFIKTLDSVSSKRPDNIEKMLSKRANEKDVVSTEQSNEFDLKSAKPVYRELDIKKP